MVRPWDAPTGPTAAKLPAGRWVLFGWFAPVGWRRTDEAFAVWLSKLQSEAVSAVGSDKHVYRFAFHGERDAPARRARDAVAKLASAACRSVGGKDALHSNASTTPLSLSTSAAK